MHEVISGMGTVALGSSVIGSVVVGQLSGFQMRCDNLLGEHLASIGEHQGHTFFQRPLANTTEVFPVVVLQWLQQT